MVDLIDAGTYISIEVLVIVSLFATYFALKKDKSYGLKIGAGSIILIAVHAAFPKLIGSLLTILVGVFFISMAFS